MRLPRATLVLFAAALASACVLRPGDEGFSPWATPGTDATFERTAGPTFHTVSAGPRTALWRRRIPAAAGLTYHVTAAVRTRGATMASVTGRFVLADERRADAATHPEVIERTRGWRRVTAALVAPAGATALEIQLRTIGSGEAWFKAVAVADDRDALAREGDALLARLRTLDATSAAALAREWPAARPDRVRPTLRRLARQVSLAELARRFEEVFAVEAPPFIVGWTSPMQRVFPADLPVAMDVTPVGRLEAFRGEVEALQLVVAPRTHALREVTVTAGDLAGARGVIPAAAVEVHPVGAVKMVPNARAEALPGEEAYRGWWPDPLLDDVPVAIPRGGSQAVWVAVRVPRGAEPGCYRGPITVTSRDAPPLGLELEVQVWDFALPDRWHFRNVLSWHDGWAAGLYGARWNRALEQKFFDFLLDRRINVTSMYAGEEPYATPPRLLELAARGENAIVVASLPETARVAAGAWDVLDRRLGAVVPPLREAGLLEHALVYGWDERGAEWHGEIRAAATLLAERYPELRLLMAGVDETCGLDSSLDGVRNLVFCPLMRRYDRARAHAARRGGTPVWWYETHWTIEQPLIRSRLIPWQTYQLDADGFLVWCINRWVGNRAPIADRPRTRWRAALDGVEPHSSGLYVYPGVDGPRSSLRLENFRDGIEDYDLLRAAEARLEALDAAGLRGAEVGALRAALALPDGYAGDPTTYTLDPAAVRERRRLLARALAPGGENACAY